MAVFSEENHILEGKLYWSLSVLCSDEDLCYGKVKEVKIPLPSTQSGGITVTYLSTFSGNHGAVGAIPCENLLPA